MVRHRDAVEMLADSGVAGLGPTVWADLGCGDGTFTLALAELLAAGSVIHAMDRDTDALRRIPSTHREVRIETHRGDFQTRTWPFDEVDGILMANALHYVRDQSAFIRDCAAHFRPPRRFLIVEYDTTRANPWVPYPVNRDGSRPSSHPPATRRSSSSARARPSFSASRCTPRRSWADRRSADASNDADGGERERVLPRGRSVTRSRRWRG